LVIGHELCRNFLKEYGVPSLKEAWKEDTIFRKTQIVLPHLTMKDGELELIVDDKSLRFISLPGHSQDGIGIYIVEDEVLFSGDVWMPVPHIVDGDTDVMRESLRKIGKLTLENVVQGHGDVILRGEIESGIEDRIDYLDQIEEIVQEASENEFPGDILKENDIESCGKSRIMLDGLAEEIHQQNLRHIYLERFDEEPKEFDESVYY
jgi:glyoxylase-like metal-dependent hydrolase (beta-lactamase superfamily II)